MPRPSCCPGILPAVEAAEDLRPVLLSGMPGPVSVTSECAQNELKHPAPRDGDPARRQGYTSPRCPRCCHSASPVHRGSKPGLALGGALPSRVISLACCHARAPGAAASSSNCWSPLDPAGGPMAHDPRLQPGGLDQRLDQEGELLRLAGQRCLGLAALLRRRGRSRPAGRRRAAGWQWGFWSGGRCRQIRVWTAACSPLQVLAWQTAEPLQEPGQLWLSRAERTRFVKAAPPRKLPSIAAVEHPVQPAEGPPPTATTDTCPKAMPSASQRARQTPA